jgi:protein arginine N-methyltransferase 3
MTNLNPRTVTGIDSESDDSSTSDILDMRNEEGWEDVEEDTIPETFTSLFDNKIFPSVNEMFEYCKTDYDFDVWSLQKQYGESCAS